MTTILRLLQPNLLYENNTVFLFNIEVSHLYQGSIKPHDNESSITSLLCHRLCPYCFMLLIDISIWFRHSSRRDIPFMMLRFFEFWLRDGTAVDQIAAYIFAME